MRRWLKSIIDVRQGEVLITTLMVLYIYILLLVYYMLKPARDSLFLDSAGPALLPLVFVLIAIVVVPITTLYSRFSRSFTLTQLINITTIVIILNLFILRWMLNFAGQDWVFFTFYIWVSIYGALITSQFWLFANAIYNAAQAKRIFVIFSLAAIIGAISGGSVTSIIVSTMGISTENLLYFCIGFLILCIPLVNIVWRLHVRDEGEGVAGSSKQKKTADASIAEMFKDIKTYRHLRLIMGIIAITMATASFVDYQFKFVTTDSFSDYGVTEKSRGELTDFYIDAAALSRLEGAGLSSETMEKLAAIKRSSVDRERSTFGDFMQSLGLGDPLVTPIRGERAFKGLLGDAGLSKDLIDRQFDTIAEHTRNRDDRLTTRVLPQLIGLTGQSFESQAAFYEALKAGLAAEDYQNYRSLISDASTNRRKDEMTSFFGLFYSLMSLAGFIFQFFFSYRALKFFGVGGVILFLPFSQILGSVAMLISPNLAAAVFLRGADGTFKYSIDKTARELLFLPIPLAVKTRSKIFIDLFIDRVFRGIAGLVLLYFTLQLELTMRQLSLVVMGLVIIWVILDLMIRKEYVNAFRKALDRGEIDPAKLTFKINDASTVNHLLRSLEGGNDRQVTYALSMLTEVENETVARAVQPYLRHQNAGIRSKAVAVIGNQKARWLADDMAQLLKDPDVTVRSEALQCRLQENPGNVGSQLHEILTGEDAAMRNAALGWLGRYGGPAEKDLISAELAATILKDNSSNQAGHLESRRMLAAALGNSQPAAAREILQKLLTDSNPAVVAAAAASAGQLADRQLLPALLGLLADSRHRNEARKALVCYGNRIVGTLGDHLQDPDSHRAVRRNIPRVLKDIPTQDSLNTLLNNIGKGDSLTQHSILRALNWLRNHHPDLDYDPEAIRSAIDIFLRDYYRSARARDLFAGSQKAAGTGTQLLLRSLGEKADRSQERIFRLLALLYPSRDIYNAYLGIVSGNKTLRASGLEFLENILSSQDKKRIVEMLDQTAVAAVAASARSLFNISIDTPAQALEVLIADGDPWLQSCGLMSVAEHALPNAAQLFKNAAASGEPLVKETAEYLSKK